MSGSDFAVKKPMAIVLSMQEAQWDNLATISFNVARSHEVGAKSSDVTFKQVVYKTPDGEEVSYAAIRGIQIDFSDGAIRATSNPFHLALTGEGNFFQVQLPDGNTGYTRNGNFTLNHEGILVTSAGGYPVLNDGGGEIAFDHDSNAIRFDADGSISVDDDSRGRIGVVKFADSQLLTRAANSIYLNKNEANIEDAENFKITQYGLEESNISAVNESIKLMDAMRRYEMAQKTIDEHESLLKSMIRSSAKNV